MSALKHGLYRSAFMLCDRCILNATCVKFTASGDCAYEREAYDGVVNQLIDDYDLHAAGDLILAQRAAMYLIRIARTESYDARASHPSKTTLLGGYIVQLDRTLKGILTNLAATRLQNLKLQGQKALTVNVKMLLEKLSATPLRKEPKIAIHPAVPVKISSLTIKAQDERLLRKYRVLLNEWKRETRES